VVQILANAMATANQIYIFTSLAGFQRPPLKAGAPAHDVSGFLKKKNVLKGGDLNPKSYIK
jgi:hypothetical protein